MKVPIIFYFCFNQHNEFDHVAILTLIKEEKPILFLKKNEYPFKAYTLNKFKNNFKPLFYEIYKNSCNIKIDETSPKS